MRNRVSKIYYRKSRSPLTSVSVKSAFATNWRAVRNWSWRSINHIVSRASKKVPPIETADGDQLKRKDSRDLRCATCLLSPHQRVSVRPTLRHALDNLPRHTWMLLWLAELVLPTGSTWLNYYGQASRVVDMVEEAGIVVDGSWTDNHIYYGRASVWMGQKGRKRVRQWQRVR